MTIFIFSLSEKLPRKGISMKIFVHYWNIGTDVRLLTRYETLCHVGKMFHSRLSTRIRTRNSRDCGQFCLRILSQTILCCCCIIES